MDYATQERYGSNMVKEPQWPLIWIYREIAKIRINSRLLVEYSYLYIIKIIAHQNVDTTLFLYMIYL